MSIFARVLSSSLTSSTRGVDGDPSEMLGDVHLPLIISLLRHRGCSDTVKDRPSLIVSGSRDVLISFLLNLLLLCLLLLASCVICLCSSSRFVCVFFLIFVSVRLCFF